MRANSPIIPKRVSYNYICYAITVMLNWLTDWCRVSNHYPILNITIAWYLCNANVIVCVIGEA